MIESKLIQEIEDLPLSELGGDIPLDPKISGLVRVLHALSLLDENSRSCEGHIHPKKIPFPHVYLGRLYFSSGRNIPNILERYNAQSEVEWVLEGSGNLKPRIGARDQTELDALHKNLYKFTQFLFINYILEG